MVAEARKISFSQLQATPEFTLPRFLGLSSQYLGRELAPYGHDELMIAFNTIGPFYEATTRLAFEYALRVRGRGHHVSLTSHYLRLLHRSALKALQGRKE